MEGKICNNRLIYAYTEYLEEDEIRNVVSDALKQTDIKGDVLINVVSVKGVKCKHSYLWASSNEVFDFLIGFGDKGYTNIKKLKKNENVSYANMVKQNKKENKKFDMTDDEDDGWIQIRNSGETFVDVQIQLKKMEYSPERISQIKKHDGKFTGVPCTIKFSKAYFIPIDTETDEEKRVSNVWVADNIPEFVTVGLLLNYLRKFNTDSNAKGLIRSQNGEKYVNYPHIHIKKNTYGRRLWVTFNPNSTDGQFALHMCKHMPISDGKNSGKIFFKHFVDKYRDAEDSSSDESDE